VEFRAKEIIGHNAPTHSVLICLLQQNKGQWYEEDELLYGKLLGAD